jgi:hypothetical protein
MVKNNKKEVCILPDESDISSREAKLFQAFGTSSSDLQNYFMNQFKQVFQKYSSMTSEDRDLLEIVYDVAITFFHELQPCDVMEAMLIIQMIGVHNISIELLHDAVSPDKRFCEREPYVHLIIKLLKTFTQQIYILKNYRQKNQEKLS